MRLGQKRYRAIQSWIHTLNIIIFYWLKMHTTSSQVQGLLQTSLTKNIYLFSRCLTNYQDSNNPKQLKKFKLKREMPIRSNVNGRFPHPGDMDPYMILLQDRLRLGQVISNYEFYREFSVHMFYINIAFLREKANYI